MRRARSSSGSRTTPTRKGAAGDRAGARGDGGGRFRGRVARGPAHRAQRLVLVDGARHAVPARSPRAARRARERADRGAGMTIEAGTVAVALSVVTTAAAALASYVTLRERVGRHD